MDLFEYYGTDKAVEAEGVWVPFPHISDDLKIRLARAGGSNKLWEVERERALRPLRRSYRDEAIPDTKTMDALLEPFCKLIIKDWEGLTKDGAPVNCSLKNKIKLCQELPDFYAEMMVESGKLANYRRVEDEEDAGKSLDGSSGTKSTETPAE